MKVIVENIIASCRLKGDLHMDRIADALEGSKYQPSMYKGVMYTNPDPKCDVFISKDGSMKFHGLTSEDKLKSVMDTILSTLDENGIKVQPLDPIKVDEVIASFSLEDRLDPKAIYEEFKDDGVIYDPGELPGFILQVGNSGIEVLIFPEGKVVSRGADNLLDAISSLQMVDNRIKIGE